jgi:hypothetical protein
MDQKECVFIPRIVIVPPGGTVEFLNSDRLLHNLHSVSRENMSFNRTQPKGRTIPISFGKPEIVRIDCDLHSWMRGWVVVASHPFYALTDAQGRFKLDNVPAGQYTVRVWHERLGESSTRHRRPPPALALTIELTPLENRGRGPAAHVDHGTTLIFLRPPGGRVGRLDRPAASPPSSSAMVKVTLGAENTGWR